MINLSEEINDWGIPMESKKEFVPSIEASVLKKFELIERKKHVSAEENLALIENRIRGMLLESSPESSVELKEEQHQPESMSFHFWITLDLSRIADGSNDDYSADELVNEFLSNKVLISGLEKTILRNLKSDKRLSDVRIVFDRYEVSDGDYGKSNALYEGSLIYSLEDIDHSGISKIIQQEFKRKLF